jgi:polysaccharide deacetylase family protein (PEP-CTERM system associated)
VEGDILMMSNALTIDLEDYYHVSNFERYVPRDRWDIMPIRVEESTIKVLELLSAYKIKATFFVLGWIAERMPSLIREVWSGGHEIASHGYDHRLAYGMSPEDFRTDIRKSKSAIEDAIGERIYGYRATSYSIVRNNLRYLRILAEEGFFYDSSIFPVHHDRYGIPDWYRFPKVVKCDGYTIHEVPPSTFKIFGYNLPVAGGGYLRLFPVRFLSYCISRINMVEGKPAVIYFHPWELDIDQPRIKVPFLRAFRHYNNLHNTEKKIAYLLKNFKFCRISEILGIEDTV